MKIFDEKVRYLLNTLQFWLKRYTTWYNKGKKAILRFCGLRRNVPVGYGHSHAKLFLFKFCLKN